MAMAEDGKGDGIPLPPNEADTFTDAKGNTHGIRDLGKKVKNMILGKKKSKSPAQDETDSANPFAMEDFDAEKYNFNHEKRGKAVIIYNCEFLDRRTSNLDKTAMAKDVNRLKPILRDKLGFEAKEYWNLTTTDMLKKLENVSKEDHEDSDCFLCVIASHGFWRPLDSTGMLHDHVLGIDGQLAIFQMLQIFSAQNCPSLAGKPKIFLFEACRGGLLPGTVVVEETVDAGRVVAAAAANHPVNPMDPTCKDRYYNEGLPYHIPVNKDMLLAYATTPDFVSYLDDVGSPFIQSVCDHLDKEGQSIDFATLMDHAQADVARGYESNTIETDTGTYSKQKQMPWVASMWTKDVYFTPKS